MAKLTPRCPRCGFADTWNGRKCGHCPPPGRARQLWETIGRFEEQLNSTKTTTKQLLAIADACLRRVWGVLPQNVRDVVEAYERSPELVLKFGLLRSGETVDARLDFVNRLHALREAILTDSQNRLFWEVTMLAASCRFAAANRDFPARDLLSFPLPPDLERYREILVANMDHEGQLAGGRPNEVVLAYQHLSEELTRYNKQRNLGLTAEESAQCAIVRDTQIYPEVTVAFDAEWRTTTAVLLAKQMYESRDFSAMPILADALQDAGCEDPEVLEHCRAEKPHFRGCWVVEWLRAAR